MAAAAVLSITLLLPALALADGDPASDVLAGQALYLPSDSGTTARVQAQLSAVVAAAGRAGLPLRVAVIPSRADLGSVGALWRRPAAYARFLGLELSLVFRGTLLVAMPDGFGAVRVTAAGATPLALTGSANTSALTAVTVAAVRRLAAAQGRPLPAVRPATAAGTGGSGIDGVALAVLIVGAAAIAAAWTASLRARPWRHRDPVA